MPLTVRDYFESAMRRGLTAESDACRQAVRDAEGNVVCFVLALEDGRIRSADYRCTSCVTLVALCEHLRQWLPGAFLTEALGLSAGTLLDWHPEIPPNHHSRAELAVRAVQAAIESKQTVSV